MSKLFKLRKWLTIPETAKHLTSILSEDVTEADVYRLGLDGHLTLSVDFVNHALAKKGHLIPLSQAEKVPGIRLPPNTPPYEVILGVRYGEDQIIQFEDAKDDKPHTLRGVWDLPMIGAEAIDIEDKFQMLTGGVSVDLINMDGTFVKSYDGTTFYSTLEELTPQKFDRETIELTPATYMPANGLPADSTLVVRMDSIREFVVSLENDSASERKEKPLGNRERNTLLTIIGLMAMDGYGMDIHAKRLSKLAEMQGALTLKGVSIDTDTLSYHLKAAAELIPKPQSKPN